jgi:Na+/Pi-cotransporter
MLIALSQLLEIVTPYEDVPSLRILMGGIATDPLISMAFGALLAWAAHSSVAVVLLVMSFAEKGVVPFYAAMALVVGANIGTALNPLLEGARTGEAAGRRVAFGNVITRLVGAVVALPLLWWIGPQLVRIEPNLSRAVADFHTAFNVVLGLAFLALLGPFARLLERMLPDRIEAADPARPLYLDAVAAETPSIALGHAAREVLRMVDVLDSMIEGVADALRLRDREALSRTRRLDDVLDGLNREIKRYVTGLDPDSMTDDEHRRLEVILTFFAQPGERGRRNRAQHNRVCGEEPQTGSRTFAGSHPRCRSGVRRGSGEPTFRGLCVHDGGPACGQGADPAKGGISSPRDRHDQDPLCQAPRPKQICGGRDAATGPIARHQEAQRPFGGGRGLSGARSERRSHA